MANAQVANLPDLQQLLKDQQAMVSAVTTIQSSVTQAISDKYDYEQDKADQAKTEFLNGLSPEAFAQYSQMSIIDQQTYLMEHSPTYNTAFNEAALWGTGGDYKRAADAVTAIITGVGSGQAGGQVATNALAPYAAQLIGNAFDSNHGNNPNQAAQILSHAVLGAVLAYANGGNAATGAMVGGGSEAAAQYLIRELYPQAIDENGVFSRAALNETQAQNIVALTNAIGAVVGGMGSGLNGGSTTDVLANAAVDANVAKNAVENNKLHLKFENEKAKTTYINAVNQFLKGVYKVELELLADGSYNVVLIDGSGKIDKLTDKQKAFIELYREVILGDAVAQQTVVISSPNVSVGSFYTGNIDIADVLAFDKAGGGGGTSAGALIHETVEQYFKAEKGLLPLPAFYNMYSMEYYNQQQEYGNAHTQTIYSAENYVNGNNRINDVTFIEPSGKITQQAIVQLPNGSIKVTKKRVKK